VDPSASTSFIQTFDADVKINGINIKKNEMMMFDFLSIQTDPKQWKEPYRFEPERFNHESEWFKAPGGGNRNPLAFSPFSGGKRICIGKTFAETLIKFTIPIIYYHFDFDLMNPEQKVDKPVLDTISVESLKIPIKLTIRNKTRS
jgi:cytochrome P450